MASPGQTEVPSQAEQRGEQPPSFHGCSIVRSRDARGTGISREVGYLSLRALVNFAHCRQASQAGNWQNHLLANSRRHQRFLAQKK